MNPKSILIQAVLLATWVVAAVDGHSQEASSVIDTAVEPESASLQAVRNDNRLVLNASNLAWEQVRGFGLIVERRQDVTDAVRDAVAETSVRLEPTAEGFSLDFGPSGGMGRGRDGVVSLTLSSGKETSAPLRMEREAFSGFCLNPVLGEWSSDSLFSRYAADREQASLTLVRSPDAPVMEFALKGDHLVMTVTGASWNDVRAIAWRRVEGKDRTSALRDALASGTARLTPTADGFLLEIDDADLPETGEPMTVLALDTGAVLASPILPAPRR